MFKVIHLTDPHIEAEDKPIMGLNPQHRLRTVFKAINEYHSDAKLCVITGDLTDTGSEASYRAFRELLSELKVPYQLMLGNHDNRANFRRIFPEVTVDENGFVQTILDFEGVRLIFLDTRHDDDPGLGRMCGRRIAWLESALRDGAEMAMKSVIFMHHPPFSVGVKVFEKMLLEDPRPFQDLIVTDASLLHLAFGHLHLATAGTWNGISFSCNQGTAHTIALNLGGDKTEFITTDPVFDVMLIEDASVIVHTASPFRKIDIVARAYIAADGREILETLN